MNPRQRAPKARALPDCATPRWNRAEPSTGRRADQRGPRWGVRRTAYRRRAGGRGTVGGMSQVVVYTRSFCIWCFRAKRLLRRRGVAFGRRPSPERLGFVPHVAREDHDHRHPVHVSIRRAKLAPSLHDDPFAARHERTPASSNRLRLGSCHDAL